MAFPCIYCTTPVLCPEVRNSKEIDKKNDSSLGLYRIHPLLPFDSDRQNIEKKKDEFHTHLE